jgi:hypothetical protein
MTRWSAVGPSWRTAMYSRMFKNALDLISALAALREQGSAGRVEADGEEHKPSSIIRAWSRVRRETRSLDSGFVRKLVESL